MKSKNVFFILFLLTLLALYYTLFIYNKPPHLEKTNNEITFGELNPNAPPETLQFGQLVGQWDCTSYDLLPDSTWHKSKAKWVFKYTLDGYAIEDTWTEKAIDSTNNTTILGRDFNGINMRLYNPQQSQWQCVWLDNRKNTMSPIWQANYNSSLQEIVMHDQSLNWKITFFNINANSFDWNYKILQNSTWIVVSKIKGARLKQKALE
ncbi:hypothetical protein [uncultured Winogradskyella sp.]|uniref:hypothetical protein n=1 Tax=uncultured Winogradskyella sp. TaxID=395353 RepID=UPI0026111186|nr:hypothetical protein [uncultured Winogradskyella sp.]